MIDKPGVIYFCVGALWGFFCGLVTALAATLI